MKICEYEESSGSLLVRFASDETASQDPDDYPVYAYQPASMFPDITDPQVIKKRIAVAGTYLAEQLKIKETLENDPQRIDQFKAMINSIEEYNVDDLITPQITNEVPL